MEEETEAEKSSPEKSEEASQGRDAEQAVVTGEGPVARGRECPVRDTG